MCEDKKSGNGKRLAMKPRFGKGKNPLGKPNLVKGKNPMGRFKGINSPV